MDFASRVQSWLSSMSGPQRALVSAIVVVVLVGIVPQTRKYAIWIGLIIVALWIMAINRKGTS